MRVGYRLGAGQSLLSRRSGLLLLGAACLLGGLGAMAIHGRAADESAHDFFYASFYVFVPSGTTPSVSVINKTTDRMIGRIALPLVPRQIAVSEPTHLLAAIDGTSNRIALVDLASGHAQEVALTSVPQNLRLSGDGNLLAAFNSAGGTIAFVDLAQRRERAQVKIGSAIRDLMFSADDASLFVAADGLDGIGIVDVAQARMFATIAAGVSGKARITGLTRSADGLILYAADNGGHVFRFEQPRDWPQGAIDGRNGAAPVSTGYDRYLVTPIDVATDAAKIFPTGYGKYLVAPDNGGDSVTLVATNSLAPVATLRGLAGMSTVYSGWFDQVSIVTSTTDPRLLVVDLDRLAGAGAIDLPGVPGPGNVTADGSKLYVPIAAAGEIAVVDLRNRRLLATIPVDAEPTAAFMTSSFDICH